MGLYKNSPIKPLDGTMSPDKGERILDLVFGVEGACEQCLPRRVAARYIVATTVTSERTLASLADKRDPDPAPYTSIMQLCEACTALERADKTPGHEVVLVKDYL